MLNNAISFSSAEVSLNGIWTIGPSGSVAATALHIAPLGASATRAELGGTINGGTLTLNNYDTLVVQSTADLSTKILFTGNQVVLYGVELLGTTLDLTAATLAAHLDETNVMIGTLKINEDTTLTQGFIHVNTLTGAGHTFYVSSGAY